MGQCLWNRKLIGVFSVFKKRQLNWRFIKQILFFKLFWFYTKLVNNFFLKYYFIPREKRRVRARLTENKGEIRNGRETKGDRVGVLISFWWIFQLLFFLVFSLILRLSFPMTSDMGETVLFCLVLLFCHLVILADWFCVFFVFLLSIFEGSSFYDESLPMNLGLLRASHCSNREFCFRWHWYFDIALLHLATFSVTRRDWLNSTTSSLLVVVWMVDLKDL